MLRTCSIGRTLFMKLNDKLMLGFQENQSFLFVMLRNYQFMYTARDLLKAERKRG